MYILSAFDESWNIIKDLEDDTLAVAIEIAAFKTSDIKPKSVFARQLVRIMDKPLHTTFIEAMLFCTTPISIISDKSELPETLIELYKEIFFDTEEFLGRLDKLEYIHDMMNDKSPGDGDFTRGTIFQSSLSYGWKYIAQKFHMETVEDFGTDAMENISRACYFKFNDEMFERTNDSTMYRDAAMVQKIIKSGVDAKDGNGDEKQEGLMQIILDMNREVQDSPRIAVVKTFDPMRKQFIEDIKGVKQHKTIEHKTEE